MRLRAFLCIVLSLLLLVITACGKTDDGNGDGNGELKPIDYKSEDLTEYIDISEEVYKNLNASPEILPPDRIMAKNELLKILKAYSEPANQEKIYVNHVIGAADITAIYYRGYYLDESGNKIFGDGMCNFDSDAYKLTIGSGGFIAGFEYNMVGKNISDYAKFTKIFDGEVSSSHIVYMSFKQISESKTEQFTCERIDLSEADSVYGDGFAEKILGKQIGQKLDDFSLLIDGNEYRYSDIKVNFATLCENEATNGGKPVMVVECYFPYDYQEESLRNKTAYFEVYVDYVIDYTAPELNDEFIKRVNDENKFISEDELNKYEGEGILEKFENYIYELLYKQYESDRDGLISEEAWQILLKNSNVKKFPEENVKEVYEKSLNDIQEMHDYYGGRYYYSSYQYIQCKSIDEFARLYLGLDASADWKTYLTERSELIVKQRLILYYILKAEALLPDNAALKESADALKQEMIEYYGSAYESYPADYFEEMVCYEIMTDYILDNISVE